MIVCINLAILSAKDMKYNNKIQNPYQITLNCHECRIQLGRF